LASVTTSLENLQIHRSIAMAACAGDEQKTNGVEYRISKQSKVVKTAAGKILE
jgi:hypothetical protein